MSRLTHADGAGFVILHQQWNPVVPIVKLYSGYALSYVPLVELHVDIPDTILPLRNVTDHVCVVLSTV